jgi:DNA repair photolyase
MPVEYVPYMPKRILNVHKKVDEGWFWDKYSAYPYTGCAHGCEFCYCRANKYMRGQDPEDFSNIIRVKSNAPRLLRKELSRVERNVISTGDYQPAEAKYGLSRKMLEIVRDLRFPLHVIERSHTLLKDIDILKDISNDTWCCVSYSFSTVDPDLARLIEPKAPSPKRRMEAIKILSENGILSGLAYMPIIPFISDSKEQIEETFAMAKEHGAAYVLPSSMTMEDQQSDWFIAFLREEFPELPKKYEELYRGKYSPPGSYMKELMEKVNALAMKHEMALKIDKPKFSSRPFQSSIDNW